ncbi:hypothetical protein J2S74_005069 [Evansella vedderi]|uniref:Uncharacterized protein n=1 Tax=Evansella vedderi TaxID=38282 RepID=A0ABU0A3M7_9BACI|nr:hypothetical protein [Evansella vedderi]MDQ0257607.1 hypothetical protein [Evansella vedderi]
MKKPNNEFIKGQKFDAVEEFSREISLGVMDPLRETYEILSPKDTEDKNEEE